MDSQKALSVLIEAVNVACSKGAYTLKDAKLVAEAVEILITPAPQAPILENTGTAPLEIDPETVTSTEDALPA